MKEEITELNKEEFIKLLAEAKDIPALYIAVVASLAAAVQKHQGEKPEAITSFLNGYTLEQIKEAEEIIIKQIHILDESEEATISGLQKEEMQKQNYAALAILREYNTKES